MLSSMIEVILITSIIECEIKCTITKSKTSLNKSVNSLVRRYLVKCMGIVKMLYFFRCPIFIISFKFFL
jgi:O-phosphoseryl-tRNA(Cys) synthetase